VKVVSTVLRGGRGLYLKPSPLPDRESSYKVRQKDVGLQFFFFTKVTGVLI
jgi:hypothetical protein